MRRTKSSLSDIIEEAGAAWSLELQGLSLSYLCMLLALLSDFCYPAAYPAVALLKCWIVQNLSSSSLKMIYNLLLPLEWSRIVVCITFTKAYDSSSLSCILMFIALSIETIFSDIGHSLSSVMFSIVESLCVDSLNSWSDDMSPFTWCMCCLHIEKLWKWFGCLIHGR